LEKDTNFFDNKTSILTVISIALAAITLWLLQENGPWDLFVFMFIVLPIDLILLALWILKFKN